MKIYHNPKCSKSRQTLEIIKEKTSAFEIVEYLKKNKGAEKPLFKGAHVDESVYAADQLSVLENLKSKEELIGDIITLLQSPVKNVISGLQSGGNTLAGLIKTLEERAQ